MRTIIKFLIHRPLTANLISVLMLAIGVFAFFQLNRQASPLVDMDQVRVVTYVPSASPSEMELSVTTKLEEALDGVNGILKYYSYSSEGTSTIEIYIDPEAPDKEGVKEQIRSAIDSVTDLPAEVEDRPKIFEIKVDEIVVYELAIMFDQYDPERIVKTARELKRRLLSFPGIAKVRLNEVPEREIKILLDPKKLNRYQVGFDEVISAIQDNKVRLSAGSILSESSEKGLITISDFENPKDIGELVIRSTTNGQRLLIKDVAQVIDGYQDRDVIVQFNGKPGASLSIFKKSSADIIKLVEQIEALKEDYLKNGPKDLHLSAPWDFSIATRTRLDIVSSNLAAGFVMVLFILFLFLDYRIAFWTAAGIPIAICAALAIMPSAGVSINSVSLCGMILVLGMIVDDAIIIAENVYRKLEEGIPSKTAALEGTLEVIKPVFAMVVTTIIAFLPLYFLPGMIGDFAIEVPTVLNIMLVASLLEALFILPCHLAHRRERKKGQSLPPMPLGQILINLVKKGYLKLLGVSLRWPWLAMTLILMLAASGFYISRQHAKFRMFDLSQSYRIYLMGEVKNGASLAFTKEKVDELEGIIKELPSDVLVSYKSTIGIEGSFKGVRYPSSSSFLTEIVLTPFNERTMTSLDVVDYVKNKIKDSPLANDIQALDIEIDSEGPPVGRPLEIRVVGDDQSQRHRMMDEVLAILQKYPLTEVTTDHKNSKEEIHLLPRYRELAIAGLTVSQIAKTVRVAYDGLIVSHLQTPIERVPFRVLMEDQGQKLSRPLNGILVRNRFNNLVSVNTVMDLELVETPRKLTRYNGNPANLITANIGGDGVANEIYRDLQKEFSQLEKNFPGYQVEISGEAQESHKFIQQIIGLLILAIFGIYCWLVIQLNSLVQPLMVVLVIPFGLLGIVLAFISHGYVLSILAMVGIVGVGGVLVNDSLIMVEFINRIARSDDQDTVAAILEGADHRFRPIVLTTLTTVIGLLPTAYGLFGGTDSFISPLVFAMSWGLLVGTPSVLFVIPILYAIIFKRKGKRQEEAKSRMAA